MVNQNKKVMSIAIDPELHNEVKRHSKQRGLSTSLYVHDLIEKSLKIDFNDEIVMFGKPADQNILPVLYPSDQSISPVVLKIPTSLKGDPEGLKAWLEAKVSGLVNKLS
jgi:hypothetical protein